MGTQQASKPTAATEQIRKDRQLKNKVAIPFLLKDHKTVIHVCRKTSAEDSLFDNAGIIKIDSTFDAVALNAVVWANNIHPASATVIKTDGDNESISISYKKFEELKKESDKYKVTKGRQTFPSLETKKEKLYYALIGKLKIGRQVAIGSPAIKTDAEKFLKETGMKEAKKSDLPEIIMNCNFPRLAEAKASNGTTYPVDPAEVDKLPAGWIVTDLGSYTKEDFHIDIEGW